MEDYTFKNMDEDVSLKDFELSGVLGQGSFGKVFVAKKRDDNKVYAIKVLDKYHILKVKSKY